MIRSMTGYGRGEHVSDNRRFKVEIKSVNHRYGEITIKLPRFLNALEDSIRKRISPVIQRGKADVFIYFESFSPKDVSIKMNAAFAVSYVEALKNLAAEFSIGDSVTLSMLASHPEMFSVEKDAYDEGAWAELTETLNCAVDEALASFNAMREAEGAALYADIAARRGNIISLTRRVKERAPSVAEEYSRRLRSRIEEALSGTGHVPDEGRLLTEIALFADKSSVDEEIARLESHIAQLGAILDGTEPAGRKLDFLVQELNREANTIGSKSNDAALTGVVVDLKSEIEKIREQIQNIE